MWRLFVKTSRVCPSQELLTYPAVSISILVRGVWGLDSSSESRIRVGANVGLLFLLSLGSGRPSPVGQMHGMNISAK